MNPRCCFRSSALRREFELHTAESGSQALEILRRHEIHVIMTDQRMPGMTGVELIEQARHEYPDAIRIVFTGYADLRAVIDAINRGGLHHFITKPWDPDELIEVLHQAAVQYNMLVERKQLMANLQEHLQQELAVFEELLAAEFSAQAKADLDALGAAAGPLLVRLGMVLQHRAAQVEHLP